MTYSKVVPSKTTGKRRPKLTTDFLESEANYEGKSYFILICFVIEMFFDLQFEVQQTPKLTRKIRSSHVD